MPTGPSLHPYQGEWLGEVKVSCILHQLKLAFRCARPAILAVGKGRG